MSFSRDVAPSPCREEEPIRSIHSWQLMDSDGFHKELGVITADLLCSPAGLLVTAWNRKVTEALGRIAPIQPLLPADFFIPHSIGRN